jgi:hypothetical protein
MLQKGDGDTLDSVSNFSSMHKMYNSGQRAT